MPRFHPYTDPRPTEAGSKFPCSMLSDAPGMAGCPVITTSEPGIRIFDY